MWSIDNVTEWEGMYGLSWESAWLGNEGLKLTSSSKGQAADHTALNKQPQSAAPCSCIYLGGDNTSVSSG